MYPQQSADEIPPEVTPDQISPQALEKQTAQYHSQEPADRDSKPHHVTFAEPNYTEEASPSPGSGAHPATATTVARDGEHPRLRVYDVKRKKHKICGLRRKTLWIVLTAVVIGVCVGFGCGVSVGMAASRGKVCCQSSARSERLVKMAETM